MRESKPRISSALAMPAIFFILAVGMGLFCCLSLVYSLDPTSWSMRAVLGIGGIVFGVTNLIEFCRSRSRGVAYRRLRETRERWVREYNVDPSAIPVPPAEFSTHLLRILPDRGGYTVVCHIACPEDFADAISVIDAIVDADVWQASYEGKPPVHLFTALSPTSVQDDQPDSDAISRLLELTTGRWYFLASRPLWRVLIHTARGCLVKLSSEADSWYDLTATPRHLGIDDYVRAISDEHLPQIRFRTQLAHLARISDRVGTNHLQDFADNGHKFDEFSDLLVRKPAEIFRAHKIDGFQRLQDIAFLSFARELLSEACSVWSVWPLMGDSLRYVTSPTIAKWQSELSSHLVRADRPGYADRYLLIPANWDNARSRCNYQDGQTLPVVIGAGEDSRQYDVPPLVLLEAVIGKYFWSGLSSGRLSLFIVPICQSGDTNFTWIAHERYLTGAGAPPEQIDRAREKLLSDWVMFERQSGAGTTVVIQFDERLDMVAYGTELLVHRYVVQDGSLTAPARCLGASQICKGHLVSPFCCLRKSLSGVTGDFAAQRFERSTAEFGNLYSQIEERLGQNPNFYESDWHILLPALGATERRV